jgi:hypothetical protein
MSNHLDLSKLTIQELEQLLVVLRGTSQAQSLYREYSSRPSNQTLALEDPDWDHKFNLMLQAKFDRLSKGATDSGLLSNDRST